MVGDLLITLVPLCFNGRAFFLRSLSLEDMRWGREGGTLSTPNQSFTVVQAGTGLIELCHGRRSVSPLCPKHARQGRVVLFNNRSVPVCDEDKSPIPIFEVLSSC